MAFFRRTFAFERSPPSNRSSTPGTRHAGRRINTEPKCRPSWIPSSTTSRITSETLSMSRPRKRRPLTSRACTTSPRLPIIPRTLHSEGPQLLFEVEGKAFLYKQVRNMIGLLIEIGKGRLPPSIVKTILLTEDRQELAKVSPVAPAHGLYLMSVAYDDSLMEPAPGAPKTSVGRWLRHPVCTFASKRLQGFRSFKRTSLHGLCTKQI